MVLNYLPSGKQAVSQACASVQTGDKLRRQRPGGPKKACQMAGEVTHTGVVAWPPRALAAKPGAAARTQFEASLKSSNAVLSEKLQGTMRGRLDQPSYAHQSNGPHLDQNLVVKYPRRASMYAPNSPADWAHQQPLGSSDSPRSMSVHVSLVECASPERHLDRRPSPAVTNRYCDVYLG